MKLPPLSDIAHPLLALLLCATLAIWATAPAAWTPNHVLLCNVVHPDCAGNYWLLSWVADRLTAGDGLTWNDQYYWPFRDAPFLAGNGGEGVLAWPFHRLLPWPAAANLFLVSLLAANGLAAVFTARAAKASWAGALLAGAVWTLGMVPLRELASGRFSQADLVFLTLFLGLWLRLLERPSTLVAVATGLVLAATSALYWYHGLFAVLAATVILVVRRWHGAVPWRDLEVALLSFLLAVAPPLLWFLLHWADVPGTDEEVFPHPEAWRDSLDPEWPFLVQGGRYVTQALPAVVVLGVGVGLLRQVVAHLRSWRRGEGRPPTDLWLDVALVVVWAIFLALAMGPRLSLGGWSPYEALYGLASPLRRFWWPSRHVVVASLALTLLAARGVSTLKHRWSEALLGLGLAASVPILLQVQGVSPRISPTVLLTWPPPFYEEVRNLPGDVLLELPLSPRVAVTEKLLLYQRVHGKRLVTGHALWLDRTRPAGWDAAVEANTFLRALRMVDEAALEGTFSFDATDLEALRRDGLRTVVLNAEHYPLPLTDTVRTQRDVLRALFGPPRAEMPRAWAWSLDDWTGATETPLQPWQWGEGFRAGDGKMPSTLRTPRSEIFDPPPEAWSVVPAAKRRDAPPSPDDAPPPPG